ncbi:MAG: O-acetyl-ADP-ribose deacetylase [Magnetococcales bacterium]|nr:O-acetyl-ADP-ribose deacetylase [Magnetococcales bacterium]
MSGASRTPGVIEVVTEDITRLTVDAIVNAANSTLLGGGGVDGAIHRAGGPAILEACRALRRERLPDGLPTGQAVATTGGKLPARHVIHTVGPVHGQDQEPAALLAASYRNSLLCALELGAKSIAFPGISTGVYGYPKAEAARVAVASLRRTLAGLTGPGPERILLVAFSAADAEILRQALATPAPGAEL